MTYKFTNYKLIYKPNEVFMIFHYTSSLISIVMSAIWSLVTASSYMSLLFPKNVITHTSVHQTVGESGCKWSNLSTAKVQLHQIHLFAEDIDMYLHNYLELQSSCNRQCKHSNAEYILYCCNVYLVPNIIVFSEA